ncbi:coiled-coil domain-containing protein 25 [Capsicum annuum]
MVFYFKARPEAGDYTIFMGLDKYENEELIKYGFPEDIWFHVDKMSSAHVYLRLNKGQTFDDIPEGVLEDCAQLVKANSIQGNKVNNVDIVYTPWQNLKKTASMDVGQVSFHNPKMVRTVRVEKRINEIVNRLNRTKVERKPDLKAEREAVNAAERAERKQQLREKLWFLSWYILEKVGFGTQELILGMVKKIWLPVFTIKVLNIHSLCAALPCVPPLKSNPSS